jgi:ATP-dependent Lhr-like helicase
VGAPTRTRRPSRRLDDPAERNGHGADALARFSPAVRDWFSSSFETPTQAQAEGWAAISAGHHTLIHAPTGSGKTLAAFLWCLDRLAREPTTPPPRGQLAQVRVLYVSPLKALT